MICYDKIDQSYLILCLKYNLFFSKKLSKFHK